MILSDERKQTERTDIANLASQTKGISSNAIYKMVVKALMERHVDSGVLIDMGCGVGNLWPFVGDRFNRYIGVDVVRYDGLPTEIEFVSHNFDAGKVPLADATADVVLSVETIGCSENPRAFVRELVRLTKPGGLVIVTTPNQLSLLSKMTLVLKNQFNAFQEAPGLYPAYITALLEIDLIRVATECGLTDITVTYSDQGRIPFTSWHWPISFGFRGRAFSDNILCMGLKLEV